MVQTTNDDVDVLKSRIDNIELTLENQNKIISDIEASVKHCIMDRCKVYKDHLESNCIDDEFKQQLKHDILNEVKMSLVALKDDVVNVKPN